MKEPLNRTKVVIRHLPPSLSHSAFFEQIDARFSNRYNWSTFRPGKISHKNQRYARAYVNFNSPENVFEFAEFFNGHVFVNEKGAQFKAIVEYAPSQRVPKLNARRDGREGMLYKDPEYVEFIEWISKPVENLPSADIQLERREAERAGVQEVPIVTPLMEYIRKKRAAKNGNQHLSGSDVKAGGRSRTASPGKSRSNKQVSEKKKYILKASGKSTNGKDKSAYILVSQRKNQLDASSKTVVENESGSISFDPTKKKILLLKGKEQEIYQVSDGVAQPKVATSSVESSPNSLASKSNQRHDASGRIIRSILFNKESRQTRSSPSVHTEQNFQPVNLEKGKRPPRPSTMRSGGQSSTNEQPSFSSDYVVKRSSEEKSPGNEPRGGLGHDRQKQDRRTRSRERPDHGIWTPLRRSDAPHAGDECQSHVSDSHEGKHGDSKYDTLQSGRSSSYTENGSHRHFGRRGPTYSGKDDGSSKRGATTGHGVHEKQVWIQKSASGS